MTRHRGMGVHGALEEPQGAHHTSWKVPHTVEGTTHKESLELKQESGWKPHQAELGGKDILKIQQPLDS